MAGPQDTGRIAEALRLYHTLRYLKPIQIGYRLYYALRKKARRFGGFAYPLEVEAQGSPLTLERSVESPVSYDAGTFTFLYRSKTFEEGIDWNFSGYGKLWTYNLNYFDFLHQPGMDAKTGLGLMRDYLARMKELKDGLEPFPVSLRGINWIKFLSYHEIRDEALDRSLRAQYAVLADNLEYHLLGNHLLENGFSLLFGALYFKDDALYAKAEEILESELNEQILNDGAHFERSPMYHQIMLFRVLECVNLLKHNPYAKEGLKELLEEKASLMLGWLARISYADGSIPLLNDSAEGIAPTTPELLAYAERLGLRPRNVPLGESGYRLFKTDRYELVVDYGDIGPDYIPGHAHADTFSFELRVDGRPLVVDTGTSTYEADARRQSERGTAAHNTVEIDGLDQSEVWGGFRVARRAYVRDLEESPTRIGAWHDGYLTRLGAKHHRSFEVAEKRITVMDRIESPSAHRCVARLHFHPSVRVSFDKEGLLCDGTRILVRGARVELAEYDYAPQFNRRQKATVALMTFEKNLKVEIFP